MDNNTFGLIIALIGVVGAVLGGVLGAKYAGKYTLKSVKKAHKLSLEQKEKEQEDILKTKLIYLEKSLHSIKASLHKLIKDCRTNMTLINTEKGSTPFNNVSGNLLPTSIFDLIDKESLIQYLRTTTFYIGDIYELEILLKDIHEYNPRKLIYSYLDHANKEEALFESYRATTAHFETPEEKEKFVDHKFNERKISIDGFRDMTTGRLKVCQKSCRESIVIIDKLLKIIKTDS
ncbi:hypothetical protein HX056_00985 [Myroides odoratimimus]|nr:hypothetical protein [Myroides odoratimimus]